MRVTWLFSPRCLFLQHWPVSIIKVIWYSVPTIHSKVLRFVVTSDYFGIVILYISWVTSWQLASPFWQCGGASSSWSPCPSLWTTWWCTPGWIHRLQSCQQGQKANYRTQAWSLKAWSLKSRSLVFPQIKDCAVPVECVPHSKDCAEVPGQACALLYLVYSVLNRIIVSLLKYDQTHTFRPEFLVVLKMWNKHARIKIQWSIKD